MQSFPQLRARLATWCRRRFGRAPRRAAPHEEPIARWELQSVRWAAELAADELVRGHADGAGNPWRRGTRRYVMWETSYHARLMAHEIERSERAAAAHAAGMKLARRLAAM